jgi:hypothetical protein
MFYSQSKLGRCCLSRGFLTDTAAQDEKGGASPSTTDPRAAVDGMFYFASFCLDY